MIIHDDILSWAKEYKGPKFHAMLLDPPYHLTSIVKRFGKPGSAPAKGGVYRRASAGFMSQQWDGLGEDGQGIAFRPETWAALGEHLYPGGFGLAFASSRGFHRMMVAIEDAGFILHPSIFMFGGWCYLSGFPKATRVKDNGRDIPEFEQHRYGGQTLKPALEPIIMFQRPYAGRPVENIVETGAGTLWVDGSRIPVNGEDLARVGINNIGFMGQGTVGKGDNEAAKRQKDGLPPLGRWPSNLILLHSPRCDANGCAEDCGVRALDEQSGESTSTGGTNPNPSSIGGNGIYGGGKEWAYSHYGDSGPASRMFHRASWQYEVAEQLANATPLRYHPKASSAEREAGLDSLETQTRHRVNAGGLENEPRFAPTQVKNIHPTLKPLSLTKYLAQLLLPPAEYTPRRILIPFCGVASEYIGAMLASWEEVVGIEKQANYVEIARTRAAWWRQWPGWGQTDPAAILAADEAEPEQLAMFEEMK